MEEFKRLNTLSEKAMNNIVTPSELKEFRQLLNTCNESTELDLFKDLYVPNPKGTLL
jgi:hypothetical protein